MTQAPLTKSSLTLFSGILAIAIPCVSLAGWVLNNVYLKSIVPGLTPMNPVTCICFIAIGIGMTTRYFLPERTISRRVLLLGALLGGAVGIVMMAKYLFGYDLHIDRIIFSSKLGPNRLAPTTALNFIFFAVIVLVAARSWKIRDFVIRTISLAAIGIALFAIIGYAYGFSPVYGASAFNPMAIHTALVFLFLNATLLRMTVADIRPVLDPRIGAVAFIVILVTVGVSAASFFSIRSSSQAAASVEHTYTVINELQQLQIELTHAETGQRGYLITGNRDYLREYTTGSRGITRHLDQFRKLTADNPQQQARARALKPILEAKLSELAQTVALRQAGNAASAARLVESNRGQQLKNDASVILNAADTQERQLLAQRNNRTQLEHQNTILAIGAGTAINIIFIFLTLFLMRNAIEKENLARTLAENERNRVAHEKAKDEALLTSIGDGVFAIDPSGKLTLFNPVASEITGYTVREALGRHYTEILAFVEEATLKPKDNFIRTALGGKRTTMANHTAVRQKSGALIPVEDSAAPIFDADGKITGVIVVFRDVTDERRLDIAKDEFVSLVSHQLRTPATGVKNYIAMILEGYAGKINAKTQEFAQNAFDANERQLGIIEDLLATARLESSNEKLAPVATDIKALLREISSELNHTFTAHDQKFTLKLPRQSLRASVDPLKFRMAVENLISNAQKYTPPKGHIVATLSLQPKTFSIAVKDDGVGIPTTDQKQLFRRFSRIDNALSTKVGGTGLGLYMVKKIVDLHHGKILVDSAPNAGTTFTVVLPLTSTENGE